MVEISGIKRQLGYSPSIHRTRNALCNYGRCNFWQKSDVGENKRANQLKNTSEKIP